MNDEMHARYAAYLHQLADQMMLRDWEIELAREWADNDAYAQACPFEREHHIRIRIGEGFDGHPQEERREWLVHELIHAHLCRMERTIGRLAGMLPEHLAIKLTKDAHDDEAEIVVQQLARVIAPCMPLSPEIAA